MRNTGMARKVDDLGRVVVPAEMRKSFGIREGDYLDISVEDDRIILAKRQDACVFCRSSEDLKEYRGRMVCAGCIGELSGASQPASWEMFSEPES
ncbi:MAG TPA: AbrB/MazE/SpoVT family DNA-binding domain-containing protein [Actinomycetota bacterium]|nr:AbrB/MazE/SpoVT family DNA-binding domain-containing protein [Actinomycetota bacterium]